MNKYQINFLKGIVVGVDNVDGCGNFEIDNEGNLIIVQNENYNITNYVLKIKNKDLLSVSYYVNAWKKTNIETDIASIPIDFNNPTTIVKIELKDGLVDDFDVQIILKNADKASWDEKNSKKVKEKRLENLELVLNSEGVLHTVIFKPCCEEYAYTIVKWYAISRINHVVGVPGIGGSVHYNSHKPMSNTFIEECKIFDKFYCNNECAFNVAVEVSQYDKNGKKLISLSEGFKD